MQMEIDSLVCIRIYLTLLQMTLRSFCFSCHSLTTEDLKIKVPL